MAYVSRFLRCTHPQRWSTTSQSYQTPYVVYQKRFFSGGAAKPSWKVTKDNRYGPLLPDLAYYGEHATYNYFILFIRGMRPYFEKTFKDTAMTAASTITVAYRTLSNFIIQHNPDLRLQFTALMSFFATHMCITNEFNQMYQRLVDITSFLELHVADLHNSENFWSTESEMRDGQLQEHGEQKIKLEEIFEEALREATMSRDFSILVKFLHRERFTDSPGQNYGNSSPELQKSSTQGDPCGIPPTALWSFDVMPYGKDNPDARTFPIPCHEQPYRAFSLGFTTNNLSGNWGDYIDRHDNKNAIMRPARMMFTDVFIPTTK